MYEEQTRRGLQWGCWCKRRVIWGGVPIVAEPIFVYCGMPGFSGKSPGSLWPCCIPPHWQLWLWKVAHRPLLWKLDSRYHPLILVCLCTNLVQHHLFLWGLTAEQLWAPEVCYSLKEAECHAQVHLMCSALVFTSYYFITPSYCAALLLWDFICAPQPQKNEKIKK